MADVVIVDSDEEMQDTCGESRMHMEDQLHELKADIARLEREHEQMKKLFGLKEQQFKAENELLKSELNELKKSDASESQLSELEQLRQELTKLEKENIDLREERLSIEERNEALSHKTEDYLDTKLKLIKREAQVVKILREHRAKDYRKENDELLLEVDILKQKFESCQQALTEQTALHEEQQKRLESLSQENLELSGKYQREAAKNSLLERELKMLRDKLAFYERRR